MREIAYVVFGRKAVRDEAFMLISFHREYLKRLLRFVTFIVVSLYSSSNADFTGIKPSSSLSSSRPPSSHPYRYLSPTPSLSMSQFPRLTSHLYPFPSLTSSQFPSLTSSRSPSPPPSPPPSLSVPTVAPATRPHDHPCSAPPRPPPPPPALPPNPPPATSGSAPAPR